MKSKIISLILVIGLLCPQGAWSLAPPSQAGETASLVQILSHRFPKYIREELAGELEHQGYVSQDISKAIWRGLTWTDGIVIGFKDDALFNIAAKVLSKKLKRPISADAVKAVLEYHEEIHRRFHAENSRIKRLQRELVSILGVKRYRELLGYFQNQYGEYKDEVRLIEELVVNLYVEKILGNPLRLLGDSDNTITLEEFNPGIVPAIETYARDIVDRIDIKRLRFGMVLNDLYIEKFAKPKPEPEKPPESARPPKPERAPEPVRSPIPERPQAVRPPERPVPGIKPGMQVKITGSEVLGIGTVISLEGNTIVIEFASGRKTLVWSVVKTRLEVVSSVVSSNGFWQKIVELDSQIDTAPNFGERIRLMEERNRYRAQLWKLLHSRRNEKGFLWAEVSKELNIEGKQFKKAIWDYLVEETNGDIAKISELTGLAINSVNALISSTIGMEKVHWARAVFKAKNRKELSEEERFVMLKELLGKYLTDPAFPGFSFKTKTIPRMIEEGRTVASIHLVQIEDRPVIMLEGLEETFGPNKEVTIKTIFNPDYGWLFETADERGLTLIHKKLPDKIFLELIDPAQQTYVDAVEPKTNINGQPIKPGELPGGEFSNNYGQRVITEMARYHKFKDPELKLHPFRMESGKAGDRAILFMGSIKNPEYDNGYQQVAVYSVKLEAGVLYKINPVFSKTLEQWIFLVYSGKRPVLLFTGKRTNGETQLSQLENDELAQVLEELTLSSEYDRLRQKVKREETLRGAKPAEPVAITLGKELLLGQKLYKEIKRLMDIGKSRIAWEVIAEGYDMAKDAVVREVVLYLTKLYHGDLDQIADALRMKTGSFRANVLHKYRLTDEVRKLKDETAPPESAQVLTDELLERIITDNPQIKWKTKSDRNVLQHLKDARGNRIDKKRVFKIYYKLLFFRYLGALAEKYRDLPAPKKKRTICVELGSQNLPFYQGLVKYWDNYENIFTSFSKEIETVLGFPINYKDDIWHQKTSSKEPILDWILGLTEEIPQGITRTVYKTAGIALIHSKNNKLEITGLGSIREMSNVHITFAVRDGNKICRVWRDEEHAKTDKEPLQEYILVKKDEILIQEINGIFTGKSPESLIKTIIQKIEEFLIEDGPIPNGHEVNILKNSCIALIHTNAATMSISAGLSKHKGQRWATYVVEGNDKLIILWPSKEESEKPDGKYIRRVYLVKDGVCLAQVINGKKTGRKPIPAEEISPEPPMPGRQAIDFTQVEKHIADGFETGNFKGISSLKAIIQICRHFGIKRGSNEYKDFARLFFTYKFFDYLKGLREELDKSGNKKEILLKLNRDYMQKHHYALLFALVRYYEFNYGNVFGRNSKRINEILGFEVDYKIDIWKCPPSEIRNWIFDTSGKVPPPAGFNVVIDESRSFTLSNSKDLHIRLTGLDSGVYSASFSDGLDKKSKYMYFRQGDKVIQIYELVKDNQILAQKIDGKKTGLSPIPLIVIDHSQIIRKWILEDGPIPYGKEVAVKDYGLVILCALADLFIAPNTGLFPLAGQTLWVTFKEDESGKNKFAILWKDKDASSSDPSGYLRKFYVVRDGVILSRQNKRPPVLYTFMDENRINIKGEILKRKKIEDGEHIDLLVKELADPDAQAARNALDALKWVNTADGLERLRQLLSEAIINPKIIDGAFKFYEFITSYQSLTDEMLEGIITGYPGLTWNPNTDKNKLRNLLNTLQEKGFLIDRKRLNEIYYRLLFFHYLGILKEKYQELPPDKKKRAICVDLAPKNLEFYDRLTTYCGNYSNIFINFADTIGKILGFHIDYMEDIHKYTERLTSRDPLIEWLTGINEDIPKSMYFTVSNSQTIQLIQTKDWFLSLSRNTGSITGMPKVFVTFTKRGGNKICRVWRDEEHAKTDKEPLQEYILVKNGEILAQKIKGQKTGRKPIAVIDSYREIGSRKLSESEIREGMHNKYLLDCLSNPKTRESAKEALKLMRNPEKIIDFLRALEPFLLYQKNVEKNMDILEILDAINIVNEQVIKRLRDFLNYGNDNVQQKARALLNKMNRSIHEEQDRQVLEQYKKGIHYLDDSEIREIESPLTLNKLYGRETRKFKEEFSGLKEDDIKDELTQAREQQLPIRELRKKLKDLAEFMKKTLSGSRPTVKKQMSPERSALLHRSWEFVKYTANVASRKGLSEKEMLDLVKKRFPEKSNEHILKHLRRAIETIERKRREILGDLEEDDGNDPRSFMRGRSMRDVYSSASLRYRLLYDFDLTLHDYNLILQDIETLICFDLKGEPIPQSISRTNLMLLKLELKRSTDREKLVLFTTKPNINIHAALKLLKLDGVEFIKREDYERLINGTDVASALITYTKAEDYPQYRVLTIEENYYLWVNILGRVIFTDERRYPVDPLLRRELKRIGLESLIQNDPKTGHYLDLLPEVPALGQIEERRLLEKIIADEA